MSYLELGKGIYSKILLKHGYKKQEQQKKQNNNNKGTNRT